MHTNKLCNLEEMDNLGTVKQPSLNHEKTDWMSRTMTSKETESVIKNLLTKKSLGPDSLTDEFHQAFQKELIPILLKLFQTLKKRKQFLTQSIWPALSWYQSQTKTQEKY